MRVSQRLTEHLQAAADSEQRMTSRDMIENCVIESSRAHPGQVTACMLGTRQHNPVRATQIRGSLRPLQTDTGQVFEGLKLVQVADAWIRDDGNGFAGLRTRSNERILTEAVFFGEPMLRPQR